MPRKIEGEDGTEIEVFEKTELEEAAAKAAKQKEEELEGSISPNWREARQKMSTLEKERDEWREKAAKAGFKDESQNVSKEEIAKIASEQAEVKYMERYKERVLSQFGEKKTDVEKYFSKLASGEKLTEDMVDRLAQDAARAVGVRSEPDRSLMSQFGRQGSRPEFAMPENDQGFGTTPQGKSTAQAMGLIIENPNKK